MNIRYEQLPLLDSMRLSDGLVLGLFLAIAALSVVSLIVYGQSDALLLLILLPCVNLLWLTVRFWRLLHHLADKNLREQIALTALPANRFLAPIILRKLKLSLLPTLIVFPLLSTVILLYRTFGRNGPDIGEFIFWSYLLLCLVLLTIGMLALLLCGFSRMLVRCCRLQNRNRAPGFELFGQITFWIVIAFGLPTFTNSLIYDLDIVPIQPIYILLSTGASFLLLRIVWHSAVREYFRFENELSKY